MTAPTAELEFEKARWRAKFNISEFTADQLEWASRRALARGLWLPPDGDQSCPAPRRVRRLLRRLPAISLTPENLARIGVNPESFREFEENVMCTAGATRVLNLAASLGGQVWDATHGRIMVGDGGGSAPTATAADTELVAAVNAANRYSQLFTAAPTVSGTPAAFAVSATFATTNGNFHWFEFAVDQGTASGATAATAPLLNHKGLDMGTKSSAVAWIANYSFSVS